MAALSNIVTNRLYLVEWIRVGFLAVMMGAVLISQSINPFFFNPGYEVPVLLILSLNFFINVLFVLNIERLKGRRSLVFFIGDSVLISALMVFSSANLPVFVLMYLTNLLLCGLIHGRDMALYVAAATAILFNLSVTTGYQLEGQSLLFTLIFNNLSFFVVSLLSGYLSDELSQAGEQIVQKSRDVRALKDFNNIIMKNIPSALMAIDKNGTVLQANEPAIELLGVSLEGKKVQDVFGEIDLANDRRFDYKYGTASGDELILSCGTKAFSDPTEDIDGTILMFEDLTRVRRIEEKMRQSEKLAAVGQLAAGIAHEIRNPLASISGSVELMKANGVSDENGRLMNIVFRETHRLSDLISEFLEYVRPDKPVQDEVNLSNLAHEVMDIVRVNPNLRADIELESEIESNLYVLGDRNKLKQAVLNIVINAYQAMTETEKPKCRIEVESSDSSTVMRIIDFGVGMDEKTRVRIFEPFLTTKAKGTGLGLAVTHKILENHKAIVSVHSTLGEGTSFVLEFPKIK